MWNFLCFRKMLMPAIIQVVFWLLSLLCIAAGIYIIIVRHNIPYGIAIAIVSPLVIRLGCEMIMVFFRIYQTLLNIEKNLELSYESESFEIAQQVDNSEMPVQDQTKPLFDIITSDKKNNKTSHPKP